MPNIRDYGNTSSARRLTVWPTARLAIIWVLRMGKHGLVC